MNNNSELIQITKELDKANCRLITVSKTRSIDEILTVYEQGYRSFGENKAQEMATKHELLPKDIEWHFIGHLQRNKVKYIAPFVHLIHSVDSLRLLQEINKQGEKVNRVIRCLLQVYVADEETKFGLDVQELEQLIKSDELNRMEFVKIEGLMAMATFSDDVEKIKQEFKQAKNLFDSIKSLNLPSNTSMIELSMGMSGDYKLALQKGSTMVRIGNAIFGLRNQ